MDTLPVELAMEVATGHLPMEDDPKVPMMRISLQRISGEEETFEVPQDATVQVLRDAIEKSVTIDVGRCAYRLIHNSVSLMDQHAKLKELGVEDLSTLILMKERSRDYSRIHDLQEIKSKSSYPNGLTFHQGSLIVAHYFGELEVYDSNLKLVHTHRIPAGGQPGQICMAGDCLVAACRGNGVIVMGPAEEERMAIMADAVDAPSPAPLSFSLKLRIPCAPQGVAVSGDNVFVTSSDGYLSTFRLSDGEPLDHRKGGSNWDLQSPQGLCTIEDQLLAIADRGADRVVIVDIETMKCVGQLPEKEPKPYMQLKSPNDVAVDAAGNLLVMDTLNERVAVFRQDGSFVASAMEGLFKAFRNTFSYLACNHETGVIAISNNDMHKLAIVTPS